MPPIQKRAVMPSKHASKVWKNYGDNLDGEFSHCLLCKYHPKSSLIWRPRKAPRKQRKAKLLWGWKRMTTRPKFKKIQLVQHGNILHLFNIQITAHLFHGRLHLNIRICCNYPEISSGRLLLNNCWNSWSFTTRYSVRVVFDPSRVRVGQKNSSTSRVSSTRRALPRSGSTEKARSPGTQSASCPTLLSQEYTCT